MHITKQGNQLLYSFRMKNLGEFFTAPPDDPFIEQALYMAGIDHLVRALSSRTLREELYLRLEVAGETPSAAEQRQFQQALNRYSQRQIEQARQGLSAVRGQGIKALQAGTLVLSLCLILSTLAQQAEFLPEFLRTFLGEGWLIAGWVSLWKPAEMFLYEWWPYWRTIHLFQRIQTAQVEIVGDKDVDPRPPSTIMRRGQTEPLYELIGAGYGLIS